MAGRERCQGGMMAEMGDRRRATDARKRAHILQAGQLEYSYEAKQFFKAYLQITIIQYLQSNGPIE